MSYPTNRVILFDRNMNPLPELSEDEVFSRVRTEEINGEHSLVLVTTRRLQEGWRALTVDGAGKWREWVVTEIDESHTSGAHALGTYHLVWSLQYDLTYSYYHDTGEAVSIGLGSTTTASVAVDHVLDGVTRWTRGNCDAASIEAGTGCVFIRESSWSKLSKLVGVSSGEVDSEITVSNLYGVTSRSLCLKSHIGSTTALRRFDWGADLTEIKRTPDPGPYYCRIVPLGKGEQEYGDDDETTFDYPIDITEEEDEQGNPHTYWIQDDEAALTFRTLLPNGEYYYPTKAVSYDEDDPELLLAAGEEDLHNHTRPGVTYEANVLQFARAGMSVQGVALGDEVQITDYGFNPDVGLRIQGRVIKIEVDELSPETTTQLTIGQLRDGITDTINNALGSLDVAISNTKRIVSQMSTSSYIQDLIDRLNAEINATGGYCYIVPGEGIIVYDEEVADPLTGQKADGTYPNQVVQIKGGSIRIADQRGTNYGTIDDWNWRSVFTSGLIATELLSASNIITGMIEDAAHRLDSTTGSYWDLDNGTMQIVSNAGIAGTTAGSLVSNVDSLASMVRIYNNGILVCRVGQSVGALVNPNGSFDVVNVSWNNGTPSVSSNQSNAKITFGYTSNSQVSTTDIIPLILCGTTPNTLLPGGYSITVGRECWGSFYSAVFGYGNTAYNKGSILAGESNTCYYRDSAVFGSGNRLGTSSISSSSTADYGSLVCGKDNECTGVNRRYIFGEGLKPNTAGNNICAIGMYNSGYGVFEIGRGSSDTSRATIFYVDSVGNAYANSWGTTSDRRIKKHIDYLGEESVEFVRALKPAVFEKSGQIKTGFYAQDVEDLEPWPRAFVTESATGELGQDVPVKKLDYDSLIAPLVAYAQSLERRIEELENRLAMLEKT